MIRLLPLLLTLVAVTLAGAITLELQPDTSDDAPMSARPAGRQATQPNPEAVLPGHRQEWVDAVLARPLFAPDRRPAAMTAAAPGAPPPTLPRLAGILLDGPRRSVIFAAPGDARPSVIPEGGTLSGFKVQSVEAGQVTILGPDGPHILRPSFDPHPSTPVPATPVASGIIPGLPNLSALTGVPGLPSLPVAR